MTNELLEVNTKRALLKPTLQITFFSIIGVVINFFAQIIIAAKFGTTMERDAHFAALVVPVYIEAVLLSSLTITFVPIFIEYETNRNKKEAWKVASIFTNLTFLVLLGISLLAFTFARQLISITAPGFKGEELLLTAVLLRIILPSIIFRGLSSLLSSIYYAHHRFLQPAIVPVINTVLMLSSVVVLTRYWGIKSLAFGNMIGAIVGFFILVPIHFKKGRYRFSFDFHNEGVRQVIRVMSPLVLAGLFYRAGTLIQRMIASTLPTGSISYLGYATRITTIFAGIATSGISTTIFPIMAKSWAENNLAKVREYFAKGVRIIMLITFPITMIYAVLRVPIIQVVFQRGVFTHQDTLAVANVMLILLIGPFICGGLGNVVWKGFYISQRTKLASVLGVTHTLIYTFLAYILAKSFSYLGLAWASTIQSVIGILMGMTAMKFIYKGVNGRKLVAVFLRILSASLASSICVYYSFYLFVVKLSLISSVVLASTMGLIIYALLVVYIFKIDEAIFLQRKAAVIFNELSFRANKV